MVKRIFDNRWFVLNQIKSVREIRTSEGEWVIPLYEFKNYEWKSIHELAQTIEELESACKILKLNSIQLNDLSRYKEKLTPKQISTIRIGDTNIGKFHGSFFYTPAYQYNKDDELILEIDQKKLDKHYLYFKKYYLKTGLKREKKEKEKVPQFRLNEVGELYWINKEGKKLIYPMRKKGLRYKIVYRLASEKQFIPAKQIADEYEVDINTIRNTIGKIRMNIKKYFNIQGNKVIEGRTGEGYRIKCVKIIESTEG